ncbi:hypothetical protein BCR44DRAFT_1496009 [Catenaria anguillulae PL171]|uniref:Uncharacterized protein n=1 Tax=Catenaria anguillulae PL171 TaxID=765915 RepID=A0A1Y2HZ34_9FUNG|nr:hypothetical protein BCR44DRAFT_1496009 [Catenaria anguillulae PL171]
MARTLGLSRLPLFVLALVALVGTLASAQNTTLAVKCTTTADCLGPRGSTFCDTVLGVCALRTCGVNGNANVGLACSLFNSSTYCTSLPGGGSCVPRLPLDAQCNPALEVGSGMFSLPSIPGFNSNSTSVEQTNSQCMAGLKCDTTQGNVCKTDGPLGWIRYMWEANRGTIIAIGIGILALLVCCCCWGCWMCGCAAVSTACMACSCLKSCCTCCCPSGKSSGGGGGGGKSSKQPAYAAEPAPVHVPAAPTPQPSYHASNNHGGGHGGGSGGGGNVTYHEASYSNSASSAPARPTDSSGYAGKIVNIETEQIVMAPVSKPSPQPLPASAPAPPASYHSIPQQQQQQHNMYAQPIMQQPQVQYGAPAGGYIAQQPSGGSSSGSHMYAGSNVGYAAPYQQPQPSPSPYAMPTPAPVVGVSPQHSGGYYQPEVQVTKEQMMYGGGGGGNAYGQPQTQQQGYAASPSAYAQQPGPSAQAQAGGYYQQQGHGQQQSGYGGNVYGR